MQLKHLHFSMPLDFRTTALFWCVPRLRPFVLLLKAALKIKVQVLSAMCEVLTAVFVKIQVFWDVTLRPFVQYHRSYEGQQPFRRHTAVQEQDAATSVQNVGNL
jgi:hypothetical protein